MKTRTCALIGGVIVAALCGCTASPENPPSTAPSTTGVPATTSSPPTASATPSDAAERDAALAAYDRFWDAKVRSQSDPSKDPPKALRANAIDKALADAQATVLLLRRNGVEMRGAPVHAAEVTRVETGSRPEVFITDCLDSTDWLPVVAATGESALAPGQSPRVIVESVATVFDGRWVIKRSTAYRDRSC